MSMESSIVITATHRPIEKEQKYRTTVVVSAIPDSKYIAYMEKIEIFVKSLGLEVKVNIGEEDED